MAHKAKILTFYASITPDIMRDGVAVRDDEPYDLTALQHNMRRAVETMQIAAEFIGRWGGSELVGPEKT